MKSLLIAAAALLYAKTSLMKVQPFTLLGQSLGINLQNVSIILCCFSKNDYLPLANKVINELFFFSTVKVEGNFFFYLFDKSQEDVFRQSVKGKSRIGDDQVLELAQKLGMSTRQVERWFRKRKMQDRPTTLDKFSETG